MRRRTTSWLPPALHLPHQADSDTEDARSLHLQLLCLRVTDSRAIRWAVDHGVRVALQGFGRRGHLLTACHQVAMVRLLRGDVEGAEALLWYGWRHCLAGSPRQAHVSLPAATCSWQSNDVESLLKRARCGVEPPNRCLLASLSRCDSDSIYRLISLGQLLSRNARLGPRLGLALLAPYAAALALQPFPRHDLVAVTELASQRQPPAPGAELSVAQARALEVCLDTWLAHCLPIRAATTAALSDQIWYE